MMTNVDLKTLLDESNWVTCDWDNTEEQCECYRCGKVPDLMLFLREKSRTNVGVYYCFECAAETFYECGIEYSE